MTVFYYRVIVLSILMTVLICADSQDATVTLVATPARSDPNRRELLSFVRTLASTMRHHGDPVVILCDNTTMAELNASATDDLSKILYQNFELDNFWLNDLAPVGRERQAHFVYRPLYLPHYLSDRMAAKLATFMARKKISLRHKSNLKLEAGNLIHNGRGFAVTTDRVVFEHQKFSNVEDIRLMITDAVGFRNLAIVSELAGDWTGQVSNMAVFINQNTILVANYSGFETDRFIRQVKSEFRQEINFISIPVEKDFGSFGFAKMPSSCHAPFLGALETARNIYLPVTDMSRDNVRHVIQQHTDKNIIEVSLPWPLCRVGVTPRRISWQVKGVYAKMLYPV